jgi:hypothetical protein
MQTITRNKFAQHVVSNPEQFCRMPVVLGAQWAKLKEARGQRVNFGRVGDPAYQIADPENLPQQPRILPPLGDVSA